jgi:hypothetical protein
MNKFFTFSYDKIYFNMDEQRAELIQIDCFSLSKFEFSINLITLLTVY